MTKTATCACGQASITVSGLPHMHGVCHCQNCKRRSGSAFGISAYFKKTQVLETKGETQIYAFHHAPQAHDQARHFCKTCGTTLFWTVSTLPDQIGIAGGCFTGDNDLGAPTYSTTHSQRLNWCALPAPWATYP